MAERVDALLRRLGPFVETRRFDLCLAAVIALESGIGITAAGSPLRPAAVAVVVALCLAAVVRRQHAVAAALLLCPVVIAFGLIDDFASENGVLFLGLAVLCYSLGTREDRGGALVATASLFVSCQLLKTLSGEPQSPPFLFVTAGPWILGRIVESRRALVHELARRADQVQLELEKYTSLVVRRERARIAGELHDIVAHCVAVMVIQAGAGRLTSVGSREQAARSFSRIREAGTEARAEMEKLVTLLGQADPDPRPSDALDALVRQIRAAGLDVDLVAPADAEPDETAFGIVREGLTNALKHAPGAAVTVTVVEAGEGIDVDVTNGPASVTHSRLGFETSRRGLAGIRERVEARDGQMEAGALPDGGWRLRVHLPRAPSTAPQTPASPATGASAASTHGLADPVWFDLSGDDGPAAAVTRPVGWSQG